MRISQYFKYLVSFLKQGQACAAFDIAPTKYYEILNGQRDNYVSATTTVNLCKILGINPNDFSSYGYVINEEDLENILDRFKDFDFVARKEELAQKLKELGKNYIDPMEFLTLSSNSLSTSEENAVKHTHMMETKRHINTRHRREKGITIKILLDLGYVYEDITNLFGVN